MFWSVVYGALALFACVVARRSPLAVMGYGLLAVWGTTFAEINLLHWALPVRVLVYTGLNLGLICLAIASLHEAARTATIIMALSLLAIAATVAYAWHGTDASDVRDIWSITTNIIFGASCLVIAGSGIWNAVVDRSDGVIAWPGHRDGLGHGSAGARVAPKDRT